jgi:UDP:flavonoid glycosyltransferase YjiC (YdhE family)
MKSYMRVLFIPFAGVISHTIPLIALSRMLDNATFKTAFLLPRKKHQVATKLGLNIIDLDYASISENSFRTELRAYGLFSPDVVIDDTNITTFFASSFAKAPRVTIQRTDTFPGGLDSPQRHQYGPNYNWKIMRPPDVMGIQQPRKPSELFNADYKIVPGVPSIEQLLPAQSDDPTYFFSGPLLLEDHMMEQVIDSSARADGARNAEGNFTALESFFAEHAHRRRIYITFGTVAKAGPQILSCMRRLLRQRTAVVTSIEVEGLSAEERQYYFYAPYLPMNYVCRNVDLMVHQCGCGTYHYPIMHQLPMITIGTRHYGRDIVALRLQELGVSTHLGVAEERADFEEAFQEAVERYYESDGELAAETRRRMAALNEEISRTAAAFNLEAVLQKAVKCAR